MDVITSYSIHYTKLYEVDIEPSYDPLVNDNDMVEIVRTNATSLVGEDNIEIISKPNMGVEDFGYYVSRVPGAFV